MAKLVLSGNSVTITSTITLEEFEKIKKFNPEGLALYRIPERTLDFKIDFKTKGSCSPYGIIFDSVDENNKMYLTLFNDALNRSADKEETLENILNDFATLLNKLQVLENNFNNELENINEIAESVKENIEII